MSVFDVELTCYGGVAWSAIDQDGFTEGVLPNLTAWTDLSADVRFAGNLTYERIGNTLRWQARLSGKNYNESYFGLGQAIVMLRRITVQGSPTVEQGLWFVGQIVAGDHRDDYLHGGDWTRTVVGLDGDLERANAPRLAIGPVNLFDGASATASSTLATVAVEAGNGEFLGTVAEVDADNACDSNLNTVWISEDTPRVTGESIVSQGEVRFTKVFIKPITGYDATKFWWIELYSSTGCNLYQLDVRIYNRNCRLHFGGNSWDPLSAARLVLNPGERGVLYWSKAEFDAYTGGAPGVAWEVECKNLVWEGGTRFTLDADDDWIAIHTRYNFQDAVIWNSDGSDPGTIYYELEGENLPWNGNAIDSSAIPAGYTLRRDLSTANTHTVADWSATQYAPPGAHAEDAAYEWLMLEPVGQDAALAAEFNVEDALMTLTATTGFPSDGEAVCEGEDFAYGDRTASTLTITRPPANGHAQGAAVYPVYGGLAMTGWPCAQVEIIRRPGLSVIGYVSIYVQQTGETTPATPLYPYDPDDSTRGDWRIDWDDHFYERVDNSDARFVITLRDASNLPRWVRRMLVVVRTMSDDGRAKVNDIRLMLDQPECYYGDTSVVALENLDSQHVAKHLLLTVYGLPTDCFRGLSGRREYGIVGAHTTAIAAYTQVLDDLARISGCCVEYQLDNRVHWRADQWWPVETYISEYTEPYALLGAQHVRGQVVFSGQRPTAYGVVLHGRSADGTERFTQYFPPQAATQGQTIAHDDLVCSPASAEILATALYAQDGLMVTGGPLKATFVVRGVGEWLRPDMWIELATNTVSGSWQIADFNVATTVGVSDWLVQRVTWSWSMQGGFKRWEARAECQRYGLSVNGYWDPPR